MAVRKIAFPLVFKQNRNTYSSAYSKFYLFPFPKEALTLGGLLKMCAFDQSVYTDDIVKGVVASVTKVMVELLQEGQPVKWDGLGTFKPTIQNVANGASEKQLVKGEKNLANTVKGVHIRFIPEGSDGEDITSRVFADTCVLSVEGVAEPVTVGVGKQAKTYYNVKSLAQWRKEQSNP